LFNVPELDEITAGLPALVQSAQIHFATPPMTSTTFTGEKKAKEPKGKRAS